MTVDMPSQIPSPAELSRRGIPGARSPFPLVEHVPALLADDPMVVAFLEALDEVWAPIISTLDCFDAYLDPRLAPPDMVAYLGSWILALLDEARTEEQLREDVTSAHTIAAWSGTARVLHERLVPREAEAIEIIEPGGVSTSSEPTDPRAWDASADATITVSITAPRMPGPQGEERLRRLVRDLVPAHLPVRVLVG